MALRLSRHLVRQVDPALDCLCGRSQLCRADGRWMMCMHAVGEEGLPGADLGGNNQAHAQEHLGLGHHHLRAALP